MQSKVTLNFNKAASRYNNHASLQNHIAKILANKIAINKTPATNILDLGCGTGYLGKKVSNLNNKIYNLDAAINMCKMNPLPLKICGNAQQLPFVNNYFNLVMSNLVLQWLTPNLNDILQEIHRVLTINGNLSFSTLGPDTLQELRYCSEQLANPININQQLEMHTLGDILATNNFTEIIMDRLNLEIEYQSLTDLLKDLRGIGANTNINQNNNNKSLTKTDYQQLQQLYTQHFSTNNNRVIATYEIIFGQAKPKTPNNEINPSQINLIRNRSKQRK